MPYRRATGRARGGPRVINPLPLTEIPGFELELWHGSGKRAPGERVSIDGQDIVETVPPDQWPEPYRTWFGNGWRPWLPPGHSYVEG